MERTGRQNRTNGTGPTEQDMQNGTDTTGQTQQDRQNRTDRMGQTEQDRQNWIKVPALCWYLNSFLKTFFVAILPPDSIR
jgi:hypothetical protein